MNLLLSSSGIDLGSFGLQIAIIVVSVLLGIGIIYAFITRISIWVTYHKYNKIANSEGLTAEEAAVKFKDLLGMQDVQVKKCSFWRAMLSTGGAMGFGNNYSIYKKTIFLRKNILNKTSLTAVGLGTQKVGLALQDKEGNKTYQFTARVKPFVFFAPSLVLPLIIIGLLLDLLVFNTIGISTIIFGGLGLLFYFLSFIIILFTIKVEKRANKTAIKLMEENNFLTAEERVHIQKLYNAYIRAYIADFIIALLELILNILKVLQKLQKIQKK